MGTYHLFINKFIPICSKQHLNFLHRFSMIIHLSSHLKNINHVMYT
jgi:hypothetical protein